MKAWAILGCTHNGEIACPACWTPHEAACMAEEEEDEDIHPVFASDAGEPEYCGRCGADLFD